MTRTLYRISEDLLDLEDILTATNGEIGDDEAGQAIEEWFDKLGEERDQKIDDYCALIAELDAKATAREAEADRLMALARADQNAVKMLKARLKAFLDVHGLGKLDTGRFKLTIAKNGGAPPLLLPDAWIADPATAPERFHRRVIQLDRASILAALEAGEEVPGASIGGRGTHLRIR